MAEFKNKQKQNAYDIALAMLTQLGLESMAQALFGIIQQGYTNQAVISAKLADTPEYKKRFAGNEIIKQRIANGEVGLHVLSPAEYINQENQYRSALADYGLPTGFYDSVDDFASWIGKDVSPSEVRARAAAASDAVTSSNPEYRQALKDYYGMSDGDLVAYFLDQKRSLPVLERQAQAAKIGGAALEQGLNVSAARADTLAGYGVDQATARQGYSAIGQSLPTLGKLAAIDNTSYDQADAENAFLLDNADAVTKTKKLASNERARFSGSSGIGQGSLSSRSKGQY